MSSFRRKAVSKQPRLPGGTRQCSCSQLTAVTSTGIPSLDDILGGGLPLSCSLLVLAPDHHSAYGELLQKYFIAQGLASGQTLCVLDDHAQELVKECMWMSSIATSGQAGLAEDEDESTLHDDKVKIAWRYEQMKKFQTTVSSSAMYVRFQDTRF
jgi:elongator complex protein 4